MKLFAGLPPLIQEAAPYQAVPYPPNKCSFVINFWSYNFIHINTISLLQLFCYMGMQLKGSVILHFLQWGRRANLGKKSLLAPDARMIPISLLFLMLQLLDQLISSCELFVVPKYFYSIAYNAKFCILLQIGTRPDINKGKINFCGEV